MPRPVVVFLLLWSLPAFAVPVPKAKPVIDVRDPDGTVLLAAADLTSYDWDTHTLTLKEGAKEPFLKALGVAGRFAVCVDGQPVLKGTVVTESFRAATSDPVLLTTDDTAAAGGGERVVIHRGHGGPVAHPETRTVPELKAALQKAGKLQTDK